MSAMIAQTNHLGNERCIRDIEWAGILKITISYWRILDGLVPVPITLCIIIAAGATILIFPCDQKLQGYIPGIVQS